MAEGLNPFMTDDFIENEVENYRSRGEEPEKVYDISLDAVASKLIKDKFLLTALELHTELVESGRELARLRDYFSNPVNFEQHVLTKAEMSPGLPRTTSVQTFDSLDFARYSDDGERQVDERVAVLEFEIRKARETIKALRADLTMATESSGNTPDSAHEHSLTDGAPMRPHEKRALNFLVNEYLLHNNYKLTSITFSDENEDQDFEDWDEVGLNIPKPPDLLHLYRDFGQHQSPLVSKQDFSCHVNMEDEDMDEQREQYNHMKEQMEAEMADMRDQITLLTRENEALLSLIKNLEKEIVNLNAYRSTPAASPMNTPTRKNSDSARSGDSSEGCNGPNINKHSCQTLKGLLDSQNQLDNISNNTASHTEDSMEIDINIEVNKPFVTHTLENGNNDTRWRNNSLLENCCNRKVSPAFHKALLSMTCAHKLSQESRLALEVSEVADSNEKAVLMLGRCLPHIVPNVLLAKREELIPLILCTVSLHPDVKDRDKLLNILFNLIKRPDDEQRQMILTGCVTFAQHVGPTRVEAELLPQCWEQIGHKYPERRLLVAESCGVLAPYLPNEIRSSLLLSMLQQMLTDDKADTVREAVTKSLGLLMAFIDDKDKYSQGSELLLAALSDLSEKTVVAALHIFLPAFAAWAFELGKLEKELIEMLLKKLENFVKNCSGINTTVDDQHLILLVKALQCLVPFLFASVLQSGPYMERLVTDPDPYDDTRFPDTSPLEDLAVIVGDRLQVSRLVTTYERHIAEEWYENWSSFDWVCKQLIPRFLKALNSLDVSLLKAETIQILAALFTDFCRTFGRTFTQTKIKPQFQEELKVSEEQLDTQVLSGKTALTSCTVPVYVTGVLTAHNQEEDRKEMTTFLQELLCTLSLCHAPLDSIRATFALLGTSIIHHELLLAVLWDGVVHTSALVRTSAAHVFELLVGVISDHLLASRVVPGLITLAGDPEISVRIATIPTFGIIMETSPQREMLEKVYLQFQAFMDDPIYKDQHALQVEIIRTFGRMGPNAEPKFRDEFVLPRLAILATHNNHVTNETKKTDISMALFEAYSALSCCFINDQLISEVMLPGLRCLRQDLSQIAPEHEEVVASMIRDYENKLNFGRPLERSLSVVSASSSGSVDDVRHKVISKFKDFKDKSSNRPNIANIFSRKK